MTRPIEHVAVLGAGTMGAAIAAHAANAGLSVLLLDIVPRTLAPEEKERGLTLSHPTVKNRVARSGLERIARLKPPSFMSEAARRRVRIGNLEDDLGQLAQADWIVEAVVERLEIKRALLARIDQVRRPGSLVTTNTSGLPIASIVEGRSEDLRRHFFGTHFFNPPRYMKLLEVIAGESSDPDAVAALRAFAERRLGKGVVAAKDRPNFVGNRILSVHGSYLMGWAFDHGYSIEEVDAVTGPLIGRPKTATFRLQDLVGIDVSSHVAENLYALIPEDPEREALANKGAGSVVGSLIQRGWLGNKSGQGFYRKTRDANGKTVFLVLDPKTFEYHPPAKVHFAVVDTVRAIRPLGKRLNALFGEVHRDDRAARLAWAATAQLLSYAARVAPEITFDLHAVDNAIRWGFSYQMGPFELWDALGLEATAERLEHDGYFVAPWVKTMIEKGEGSFYRYEGERAIGMWRWDQEAYALLTSDPRILSIAALGAQQPPLASNPSASLHDLGDSVLLAEFHTKANAIDSDIVAMLDRARAMLDEDAWVGLVIGNDGLHFSAGANLSEVAKAVQAGDWKALERVVQGLQRVLQGLRYASKPVVSAVHGMALGGGCEVAIGTDRALLAAESYIGLVEVGVGLVPAGGGLKELVRRVICPAMKVEHADPLPAAQKVLEMVGTARVSSSAAEAFELGFFSPQDRVVMNRDHLLLEAKHEVIEMVASGYTPPAREPLYAGGRDLRAALGLGVWSLAQAGWASEHDAHIAQKLAGILAGGDASRESWQDEDWFLQLERQAFIALLKTEKTQARIRHMLETGKPLRN